MTSHPPHPFAAAPGGRSPRSCLKCGFPPEHDYHQLERPGFEEAVEAAKDAYVDLFHNEEKPDAIRHLIDCAYPLIDRAVRSDERERFLRGSVSDVEEQEIRADERRWVAKMLCEAADKGDFSVSQAEGVYAAAIFFTRNEI